MIYWLKKLEWKIIKFLGLEKKRNQTSLMQTLNLFRTMFLLIFCVWLGIQLGQAFAHLWWWFFPRVVRAPLRYL